MWCTVNFRWVVDMLAGRSRYGTGLGHTGACWGSASQTGRVSIFGFQTWQPTAGATLGRRLAVIRDLDERFGAGSRRRWYVRTDVPDCGSVKPNMSSRRRDGDEIAPRSRGGSLGGTWRFGREIGAPGRQLGVGDRSWWQWAASWMGLVGYGGLWS